MIELESFVSELSEREKEPLMRLLNCSKSDAQSISRKVSKLILPAKGFLQSTPNYRRFLEKIAQKSKILDKEVLSQQSFLNEPISDIEAKMLVALFQTEFEKMSEEERHNYIHRLEESGLSKDQIGSVLALTTIVSAQASGFGIYILASTTLGAISSLFGIALPFAVYAGMSSLISTLIGPVGFLLVGILLYRAFKDVRSIDEVWQITKESGKQIKNLVTGDYDTALLVFKYLASARFVKRSNASNEIEILEANLDDCSKTKTRQEVRIKNHRDRSYEIKRTVTDLQIELDQCTNEIKKLESEISSVEYRRHEDQSKREILDKLIKKLS